MTTNRIRISGSSLRKDGYIRFRIPGWQHTLIKQIAADEGKTLTALFDELIAEKLDSAGIKVEFEVKVAQQ